MNNQQNFNEAQKYIPGGVNSPVRSFNAVGGTPFFTDRAYGCHLVDVEGRDYIDYVCSWGANIVGHAHPQVMAKVSLALSRGFSFGTPTELEVEFARTLTQLMPSLAKFRLVSSGTEAVMSAIRLARGYSQKKYIIKFNGCYHGHSDCLLIKAGSGLQTLANPSSAGIPEEAVRHTLVLEYNDVAGLLQAFKLYPNDIAAVIVEPFAGNMNLVRPSLAFMATLRELCTNYNSVLIFDEVMTGFRVALGGAQQLLGITPDLTTLGKVIGGGMPLAGFGGRAEIMECLAPLGSVYQAGTLSGNPIAVSAGLANLALIQEADFYPRLSRYSADLVAGLSQKAHNYGLDFCGDSVGGMFGIYFSAAIPQTFSAVKTGDAALFKRFFHLMLAQGVFLAPSMFEAGFVCAAHDQAALAATINAAEHAFKYLAEHPRAIAGEF